MTHTADPCEGAEQVGYTDGQRAVWRDPGGVLFGVVYDAKGVPYRTTVYAQEVVKWLKTPIPWKP